MLAACRVSVAAALLASAAPAQRVCLEADPALVAGENWITPTTAADLDGDGRLDFIAVRGALLASRNLGGGTFAPPAPISPSALADVFALGDVDGDGDLDAIVHRDTSQAVVVHVNQGGFAFQELSAIGSSTDCGALALGDLDGDSDLDALVAGQNNIRVLRNSGGGQFGSPTYYSATPLPTSLTVGDVDGDGDLDVLAGLAGNFGVYRNDGAGNLAPIVRYAIGFGTTQVATLDVDRDGDLDVIALSRDVTDSALEIWSNDGIGVFSRTATHDLRPSYPAALTIGDVTGDGRSDITTTGSAYTPGSAGCSIFVDVGNGTFERGADYAVGVQPALVDVDDDGDLDWVTLPAFDEVRVHRNCIQSGASSCSGSGPSAGCPCGNDAPVGATGGCLNSLGRSGRLVAHGSASLGRDDLVLGASRMVDSVAVYVQSSTLIAPTPFGDGLGCLGAPLLRLGTKQVVGGNALHPGPSDARVSVRGAVVAPGTRHYQVWYRDAASYCTPAVLATTNVWSTTWAL